MFIYKDFSYVNYILDLSYIEGLKLYAQCIDRFNNIIEEKHEDKLFKLYMFDIQNGNYEGSFEDYKNKNKIKNENKSMTKDEARKEFDRISQNANKIIQLSKKRIDKNG